MLFHIYGTFKACLIGATSAMLDLGNSEFVFDRLPDSENSRFDSLEGLLNLLLQMPLLPVPVTSSLSFPYLLNYLGVGGQLSN